MAEELKENAMQLKGELLAATNLYEAGIQAYSVGQYPKALKLFENALEETSETSLMGGKIQIYKALTLYARRLEECIDLYTFLEGTHPVGNIRRQAGELKYIAEAPGLELDEDEFVDVPAGVKDANTYRECGKRLANGKTKSAENIHRRGVRESELCKVHAKSVAAGWMDCCSNRISFVRRVRDGWGLMMCNIYSYSYLRHFSDYIKRSLYQKYGQSSAHARLHASFILAPFTNPSNSHTHTHTQFSVFHVQFCCYYY